MSRYILIPAFLLLNIMSCIAAGNYTTHWKKGTAFYTQKQYDSAAFYFEQIAASKPLNADVYYNLGNTYYRLNKIALSVLNFERALRLSPDHKEAKENLILAQGRISNHIHSASDIFFIDWWHSITRSDKATMWAVLALITFTLIIVSMFLKRNRIRIPVQLPGIFAFICVCLLILAFTSAKNSMQHNAAVVMVGDAPLMNAEQKGKPLALIPEATTVQIKSERGSWLEVSLPDGRTGWLQQSVIEKI